MLKKRKNKNRGWIGFAVLCLIVLMSGFALIQNNDLQNPLAMTSRLLSTTDTTIERTSDGDASEFTSERPSPSEGSEFSAGDRPDGGTTEFWNIQWSEIGAVFYNLWVILVTTVIVIVVARPIGYLIKHLKPNHQTALA